MSTALYRRYRPDTFDQVIGQEHVTDPLKAALRSGRVNHAYLFSGPRGCGKTTSARILARCLNCAQGPTDEPCGECASCRDLATGGPGSLDVVEIDAASNSGVDDARDLRERAVYAPARDRYKVFILDEAHMVTPQGFNALLKLVEEPPEHVKFIFATTEPEKVIGTIRSRTHHYPFRLVPPDTMTSYLDHLCQQESVPVGKGVLPLVVRAGGGSVRDSLSVLDQLIAGSGPEGIDYATATALLGYTPDSLLGDIVDAFSAGDGAAVYRVVDRVIESGQDPRRFVEDLLERFRDLLVISTAPQNAHAFLPQAPEDLLERLVQQAQTFGPAELSRAADLLNAGLSEMTGATSPRLQLELICARILLPAMDGARSSVLSRVERMERRMGMQAAGSVPGMPAQEPAGSSGQQPDAGALSRDQQQSKSSASSSAQKSSEQAVRDSWDQLDDIADFASQAEAMASGDQPEAESKSESQSAPQKESSASQPEQQAASEHASAQQSEPSASEAQQSAQPQSAPSEQPSQTAAPQPEPQRPSAPQAPSAPQQPAPQQQGTQQEPQRQAPESHQPPRQQESQQAPDSQRAPQQQAAQEPQRDSSGADIDSVRRSWQAILDVVGRSAKLARAVLAGNAVPQDVRDGTLLLAFNNQGAVTAFSRGSNVQALEAAVAEVLGMQVKVDIGQVGDHVNMRMDAPSSGYQAPSTHSAPSGPAQTGQAPRQNSGPEQRPANRPTEAQIQAVVGQQAMDQAVPDREQYWQPAPDGDDDQEDDRPGPADDTPIEQQPESSPSSSDAGEDSADGGVHSDPAPSAAADAQPDSGADPQRVEREPEYARQPEDPQPEDQRAQPVEYGQDDDSWIPEQDELGEWQPPQDDAGTSWGQGAVEAPAVVVPPPADLDDLPGDVDGAPQGSGLEIGEDDLDFLGAYADEDMFTGPTVSRVEEQQPQRENPYAYVGELGQTAGSQHSGPPDASAAWEETGSTPAADGWGAPAEPEYPDFNVDEDLDVTESPEVGIPVVQRLLGGVILEEITE